MGQSITDEQALLSVLSRCVNEWQFPFLIVACPSFLESSSNLCASDPAHIPQGLHDSFHTDPELVAKMREASEAALAREHAAELLLYLEPATLDTCFVNKLVGCLKSPSANLCSRALAARVLCALDGEQLVPHVADLVDSAMLSSQHAYHELRNARIEKKNTPSRACQLRLQPRERQRRQSSTLSLV